MASNPSFDIVSQVDVQEVQNAISQAQKEVVTRYDLKGSNSSIEYDKIKPSITLTSNDEMKLTTITDIMLTKMVKRSVPVNALMYGKVEPTGKVVKREITLQQGLSKEQLTQVSKMIKDLKLKVTSQINGDLIRVSSKSKDVLQQVMNAVKKKNYDFNVGFTNYR